MLLRYLFWFLWTRDLRNPQLAILAPSVSQWLQLEQLGTGQTPLCSCHLRPLHVSYGKGYFKLLKSVPPHSLIFTDSSGFKRSVPATM